ncbi:MAG: tyrosine-protein phosphatase [Phycisphaerales bacterium]|nr:tyrosine-protein phosphatase [Phycisphaerales bacterium]
MSVVQIQPVQAVADPGGPGRGVVPSIARRRSWLPIALVAIVIVIAGSMFAAWSNARPKNFGIVDEGKIYRSGELTPAALGRVASQYHIRTIVDLGAYEPGSAEEARMQRTADALGLTRYVLRLEGDATGNPNNYVHALKLMNDPGKQPVLVHCSAGAQRTGCLVMLHRHIVQGRPYGEVFHEAIRHRHEAADNPYLLLMLAEWSEKIAEAYRTGSQIPGVEPIPAPTPTSIPTSTPAFSATPASSPTTSAK